MAADSLKQETSSPNKPNENINATAQDLDKSDSDSDSFKQDGVKNVEAITSVWTKKALWTTFVLIYIVQFSDGLMQNTASTLEPYITSAFKRHALLATTSVMSSIIGGVSKLTIAKIIDIWGRVEGFGLVIGLLVIGMLMKAVCQNVQTYAAAAVFYWVGHTGLGYIIDIFTADITSLRNRGILFGLNATPMLATIFAGPAIGQAFYENVNFRWAFGCFCIIIPAVALPVAISFFLNHRKAKKLGVAPERNSGRTWYESAHYYVVQFDVLGMLLITAAFALVLLPLSLASYSKNKWASGSIIAMLVVGVVCFGAFAVWEKYFAPIQFLPWKYLKDRTILGSCICNFAMFISIYCWDIYLSSFLQVVNQVSMRDANYILNSYSLTSAVIMPLSGLLLRYTGRPKWIALAAIPLACLGTGLLVYFRHPGSRAGYITMCQILNGAAGGMLSIAMPMAVMAAVNHQQVAVVLALHGLFASIGAGVGLAVSGAMWTNLMPGALAKFLPASHKDQVMEIYDDIVVQLSYEWGSPVREAIVLAYGEVQRKMVIAGACFMPLLFISIIVWKDFNLKKMAQTKGNVF